MAKRRTSQTGLTKSVSDYMKAWRANQRAPVLKWTKDFPTAKAPRRPSRTFLQRSREASPREKATYHDQLGAGRSRVKRPFLQLSVREVGEIVRQLESRLRPRLAQM